MALKFAALCALAVVIGWHPLAATFHLALDSEEFTHILLILPIAVTLIALDWKTMKPLSQPSVRGGAVLLILSAATAALAVFAFSADVQHSVAMIAIVLWWIGAFVLTFGKRVARSFLFPLCFLFWMVPFPNSLVDRLIALLQHGSASSARFLFESARVPLVVDGLRLAIPGVTLEVAKECSSIRSSLMLVVTSMVLAQLFLRSPWRKALVIAVSLPLSVAKNGLRIFTIGMLGTRVDPVFMTGDFHHRGGVIFFAIALAAIFLLLWILRKGEERAARGEQPLATAQANIREC